MEENRKSLVVVSNRLPVQVKSDGNSWAVSQSSGGLVSALSGVQNDLKFSWIGWPGVSLQPAEMPVVHDLLQSRYGYQPVFLDSNEVERFYDGFCNSVLWPLFHYLPDRVDFDLPFWDEYKRVNEKFAHAVLTTVPDDALVWVHDYHLMLLPELLRARKPKLKIGFFLHTPFPSSEIYRLLPVRKEILKGILGSDLIGFHTPDYVRHFAASCLRLLGASSTPTQIHHDGRKISYGSYPIGIHVDHFQKTLQSPEIEPHRKSLAKNYARMKVILGVDRIDYTKGLPLKFKALEILLEKHPEWREKLVLIQVGIPSRLSVGDYQEVKNEVDQLVGRINGRFGNSQYSPIQYIAHEIGHEELCALYERADVLAVTSVRDGMNLVALEYAACQKERHGVLVLSEFAGAARSMGGSLFINPADFSQTADTLERALTMDTEERKTRALENLTYVRHFHSIGWAKRFLKDLTSEEFQAEKVTADLLANFIALRREYQSPRRRILFLDYDGTLVSFTGNPADAHPPERLVQLLDRLGRDPKNLVYLISGRSVPALDPWFSRLPISLVAEHGLFLRVTGTAEWRRRGDPDLEWIPTVERILNDYSRRVPGSRVERKQSSLSWHYREADQQFGEWQALELTLHLDETLSNLPVRIVPGNKVVEVRPQGVDKGSLVKEVLAANSDEEGFIFCVGDDLTDEDMFAVLPPSAWSCRVGPPVDTRADYYLRAPEELIELLEELAGT